MGSLQTIPGSDQPEALRALRRAPVEPMASAPLEYELMRAARDGRVVADRLPVAVLEEAQHLVEAAVALCRPASLQQVDAWLAAVGLGVSNPPADERAYKARLAMVLDTSGDLPWPCWTQETRRAFARRGKGAAFFPGDGEVDAFLRPIGDKLRARARALRQVAGFRADARSPTIQPGDVHQRSMTVEALAANFSRVRQAIAEGAVAGPVVPVTPGGLASRRPRAPQLVGMPLWEARNRARKATGLPPLPRPLSFVGYGVIPDEAAPR